MIKLTCTYLKHKLQQQFLAIMFLPRETSHENIFIMGHLH